MHTLTLTTDFETLNTAEGRAAEQYEAMMARNLISQLWKFINHESHGLMVLDLTSHGRTAHYMGLIKIPLHQIRGSANPGRAQDFDGDFRPLSGHSRARWIQIAVARLRGEVIPPVRLLLAESTYFVQDGHHRISVACALEDEFILAEVTQIG